MSPFYDARCVSHVFFKSFEKVHRLIFSDKIIEEDRNDRTMVTRQIFHWKKEKVNEDIFFFNKSREDF